MTRLLAIIPARAGSKGVPGKNKALIRGRPLVDYTVASLETSSSVGGILLTTDDAEILRIYADRTSVFLVQRPSELATDTAATSAAVAHALEAWLAAGKMSPKRYCLPSRRHHSERPLILMPPTVSFWSLVVSP